MDWEKSIILNILKPDIAKIKRERGETNTKIMHRYIDQKACLLMSIIIVIIINRIGKYSRNRMDELWYTHKIKYIQQIKVKNLKLLILTCTDLINATSSGRTQNQIHSSCTTFV